MNELQVPSIQTLPTTPRIENTKQEHPVIFVCSLMNASMFRPDGKKFGFVKGLFKTNIIEDIQYLDKEIEEGNPYIKRANEAEVEAAENMFDPLGSLRKKMVKDVGAELYAELRAKLSSQLGITSDRIDEAMASKAPVDTGSSQQGTVMASQSRIPEALRARSGR